MEFTDPSLVDRLLNIKHTLLLGSWISFYRWTHNVVANGILQHKEAHMIFTAVFLGLKKEWHPVLAQIGSLLGTIIAIKDVASQEDDRIGGAPAARIIQSLPHPVTEDQGRELDCSGVDIDCEKQLVLVVYEEDPSNKTMVLQDINDFSFSTVTFIPDDTSTLEKALLVCAHKYVGKDMMITRRQLRVVKEGKRRRVVLARKRTVS